MFKKEEKKKTIKTQQEISLLSSCVVNFCWFIFLTKSQICIQSQVLAIIRFLIALWQL